MFTKFSSKSDLSIARYLAFICLFIEAIEKGVHQNCAENQF
ncbi:hypothetical protein [Clostridium sp.]